MPKATIRLSGCVKACVKAVGLPAFGTLCGRRPAPLPVGLARAYRAALVWRFAATAARVLGFAAEGAHVIVADSYALWRQKRRANCLAVFCAALRTCFACVALLIRVLDSVAAGGLDAALFGTHTASQSRR